MGHVYGAYMAVGVGETWAKLTGQGSTWMWALFWTLGRAGRRLPPVYRHIEVVFKLLLALLSISFLGVALWVGPSPSASCAARSGWRCRRRRDRSTPCCWPWG
jgi:hypothetical protein